MEFPEDIKQSINICKCDTAFDIDKIDMIQIKKIYNKFKQ